MSLDRAIAISGGMLGILAVCFGAFFTLDGRHAHQHDVSEDQLHQDTELLNRILMSESTRYAEIEKFYTDVMLEGGTLTQAQKDRLDLVQRQQKRIHDILAK